MHGDISYEVERLKLGGVIRSIQHPGGGNSVIKVTVSVSQQIEELQSQVAQLLATVTALEKPK